MDKKEWVANLTKDKELVLNDDETLFFSEKEHVYFIDTDKSEDNDPIKMGVRRLVTGITGILDTIPRDFTWLNNKRISDHLLGHVGEKLTKGMINKAIEQQELVRNKALKTGSKMHQFFEYYATWHVNNGNTKHLEKCKEMYKNFNEGEKNCADGFKEFVKKEVKQFVKLETLVYYREDACEFATQVDVLYENKKGEVILGDYKTSSQFSREYSLQMAAGNLAWKRTFNGYEVDKLQVIKFSKKNGGYKIKEVKDVFNTESTFKHLLRLFFGLKEVV